MIQVYFMTLFLHVTVDGVWTTWLDWSECSSTCNGGARNRSRTCVGTMFGGKYCEGHDVDIQICALEACPSGNIFILKSLNILIVV